MIPLPTSRTGRAACALHSVFVLCLLGTTATAASASDADPPRWRALLADTHLTIRVGVLYGDASGFVQTPSGGRPATTSPERPTLREIGIDDLVGADLRAELEVARFRAFWGFRIASANERATLRNALLSQRVSFAAGDRVESDLQLNRYHFGYGANFDFGRRAKRSGRARFSFIPIVDGSLFDFDYRLRGPSSSQRVSRHYSRFGLRLGGRLIAREGPFSLEFEGYGGLPIGTLAQIHSAELIARYEVPRRFFRDSSLSLVLGIAYERIDFEDSQGVPNKIELELGPQLSAGIELRI